MTALGLASRRYADSLPPFIADYTGDTLWALLAFIVVGMVCPRWGTGRVAGAALAISYGVEISQLYHAPWIEAVRHTRLGAVILGFGFLWSDLVCYAAGVAIGAGADAAIARRARSSRRADR